MKVDDMLANFTKFAIGELKETSGSNPLTWFRLYPRKVDDSGWWYYKGIKSDDAKLSIHSRARSSRDDFGLVVLDNVCWSKLSEIIRASKTSDTIKAEYYNPSTFGIFRTLYDKVKSIGIVTILQ